MTKRDSDSVVEPVYWVGWGLIILGASILLITNNASGETNQSNESFLNHINDGDWSINNNWKIFISLIAFLSVIVIQIGIIREVIYFLSVNGPIPAGEFSPALVNSIILGLLAGIVGWCVDRTSIWIFNMSSVRTKLNFFIHPMIYSLVAINALLTLIFILNYAYSPIQFLLTPSVVEHPLQNLGRWQPNMNNIIAILGGYVASISTHISIRLNNPIWDWAKEVGSN